MSKCVYISGTLTGTFFCHEQICQASYLEGSFNGSRLLSKHALKIFIILNVQKLQKQNLEPSDRLHYKNTNKMHLSNLGLKF